MFGLGVQELLIIFAIILLLFGSTKLPQLAGSLGKAMKEFKKSTKDDDDKGADKKDSKNDESVDSKEDSA